MLALESIAVTVHATHDRPPERPAADRIWPQLRRGSALVLVLAYLLALPAFAAAEQTLTGEVMVILAKAEPGAFDPKLAKLPALRKPPFDGYQSMTLLSSADVRLRDEAATFTELPKGRKLMLKLLGRTADGRQRVEVSINKPGKRDYLPLLTILASRQPFFVAGQNYRGGTLIIGVRVNR
jgi:hypothetical protein